MFKIMKKFYSFVLVAVAILSATSCQKELVNGNLNDASEKFTVTAFASTDAKTVLEGNVSYWTPGDKITVFNAAGQPVAFSTAITEKAPSAKFTNNAEFSVPAELLAVYPDRSGVQAYENGVVTNFSVASTQTAVAGSYDPTVAAAVGTPKSEGSTDLVFNNIHCLVKFTVGGETAPSSVKLINDEGKKIAGSYKYDVVNNAVINEGDASEITLNGPFEVGKTYYITAIPNSEAATLTLQFDGEGVKTTEEVTLAPNKIYNLGTLGKQEALGGITNVNELMAFAAAVNTGADLSRWTDENGEIKLLADVDLTGKTWVPIGNACIDRTGALQTGSAPAFTGIFNGDGHKVTGLTYTPDGTTLPTCSTLGFFGALSGATVKNLTVEVAKIYTECPALEFSLGGIAGAACNESTILNCTVLAANEQAMIASKQTVEGTVRNNLGGIVGLVGASTVDGCVNNCPVRVQNSVNTHNGGNAYQLGGIFGYCQGESFAKNCTNNAELGGKIGDEFWGDAPRMGGIVATENSKLIIENCTNNGNVLSTVSGTSDKSSRTAGILAYAGSTNTTIRDCVNNGNVCFIREFANGKDYVACVSGIFGQAGNPVTIENCENYGAILADTWFSCAFSASGDNPTMGIILSRPNTKVVTVKNCKAGGKIGPYSAADEVVTIDADNFAMYMFGDTAKRRAKIVSEGNTFATK